MSSIDAPAVNALGEQALARLATAELVIEITTAASGEVELDQILHSTLDRLRGLVAFTGGSIALVEGDELVVRAAVGPFAEQALGQRVRRGPGRSWQVVVAREPTIIDDLFEETPRIRVTPPAAAKAVRSWLAVPLERGGVGIGLLEVDSTEPRAFGPDDQQLMVTVARALAGPVELASRYADERRAQALRDAFISVISHELRTPITTIYGSSKLLRRSGSRMRRGRREETIADIEAEADRLYRLVEDLLVLSRAERGGVDIGDEPVLLGHLLPRVVTAEQGRWPTRTFVVDVTPGLPSVRGEETYIEQVLRNLLTNAGKYSPSGSTIRVEAVPGTDEVEVRVFDEGVGIVEQDTTRLFELFYRSPMAVNAASGAGIGLFVSRELVAAMGGRMWARPRPGSGSEFGFALPAVSLDDEF